MGGGGVVVLPPAPTGAHLGGRPIQHAKACKSGAVRCGAGVLLCLSAAGVARVDACGRINSCFIIQCSLGVRQTEGRKKVTRDRPLAVSPLLMDYINTAAKETHVSPLDIVGRKRDFVCDRSSPVRPACHPPKKTPRTPRVPSRHCCSANVRARLRPGLAV